MQPRETIYVLGAALAILAGFALQVALAPSKMHESWGFYEITGFVFAGIIGLLWLINSAAHDRRQRSEEDDR